MIFRLFDKFLVKGILCEVRLINQGKAFVAPLEDTPADNGRSHLACCIFEILDEKGRDRTGVKAKVVSNVACGAV